MSDKTPALLAQFQKLCEMYAKKEKKVLVVGDVMLDHRMEGDAPSFEETNDQGMSAVYRLAGRNKDGKSPGGAASVARAFSEVSQVTLIGVVGSDGEGSDLADICRQRDINFDPVKTKRAITTTKIYFYFPSKEAGSKQDGIRLDREDKESMKAECARLQKKIVYKVKKAVRNGVDAIVVKDHEKGVVSSYLVEEISKIAKSGDIPLFVDPKYSWDKYKDVKIEAILPNIKEASYGLLGKGNDDEVRKRVANSRLEDSDYGKLAEKYPNCRNLLIKADKNGSVVLSGTEPREVGPLDVGKDFKSGIGCGDVFDAYAVVAMLKGYAPEEAALFANFAAGIKSTKPLIGQFVSPAEIKDDTRFTSYLKTNKKQITYL